MTSTHNCDALLALLEAADADDETLAPRIAEHAASCPACRVREAELQRLLGRYARTSAPPLDAGLEVRLLDRLCGRLPQ